MILCGGEAGIVNAEQNGVYANEQNNKNEKVEKKGWVYNDSRFGLSYYENNKPLLFSATARDADIVFKTLSSHGIMLLLLFIIQ